MFEKLWLTLYMACFGLVVRRPYRTAAAIACIVGIVVLFACDVPTQPSLPEHEHVHDHDGRYAAHDHNHEHDHPHDHPHVHDGGESVVGLRCYPVAVHGIWECQRPATGAEWRVEWVSGWTIILPGEAFSLGDAATGRLAATQSVLYIRPTTSMRETGCTVRSGAEGASACR